MSLLKEENNNQNKSANPNHEKPCFLIIKLSTENQGPHRGEALLQLQPDLSLSLRYAPSWTPKSNGKKRPQNLHSIFPKLSFRNFETSRVIFSQVFGHTNARLVDAS